MPCPMCKTAERQDKKCPNCGLFIVNDTEADLIYGTSYRQRVPVRFSFTDRYIIIHRLKGLEKSTNGFGILGGAIVSAVTLTVKESKLPYGYYGLNELNEVIYPYRNKKFKKNKAMKFVFKDGSDFIVRDIVEDRLMLMSKYLAKLGVTVIDGKDADHGDAFCQKPFVTPDTVGLRVCSPAAGVIKMFPGNFSVEPIGSVGTSSGMNGARPQQSTCRQPAEQQSYASCQQAAQNQTAGTAYESRTAGAKPFEAEIIMVSQLGLRVKAYNSLRRAGISEISDLITRTREELLICGVGEQEADEIETQLRKNGLCLSGGGNTFHSAQQPYSSASAQGSAQREPDTKFCRMCGAKLRRSDVFCFECGADQR